MIFNSRKFYVGVVSLEIVLAVYLLYYYFGRTPDIDMQPETPEVVLELDPNVGKVGEFGIGDVQTAKFTELNDQKEIVREFGFEKLLHKSDQQWEIENPYMDVFHPDYKCHIVADKGIIEIDSSFEVGNPEDATLIGNVVVTIVAEKSSKIPDITIYLDDMTFISDRSLFFTPGPVKLISKDVQLTGRGLELIYNSELNLIEYFKLVTLNELKFKVAQKTEEKKPTIKSRNKGVSKDRNNVDKKPVVSKRESVAFSKVDNQPKSVDNEVSSSVLYHCKFNKNVFVDSQEQIVFARESLSISNVFLSGGKSEAKDETLSTSAQSKSRVKNKSGQDRPAKKALSNRKEVVKPAEKFYEAVVTCDKGFVAVPANSKTPYTSIIPESDKTLTAAQIETKLKESRGRTVFASDQIDYDVITDNVTSVGTSDIIFYPNAKQGDFSKILKVTSHESANYLADYSRILLKGDCFCQLNQVDQNDVSLYTLSSPLIKIDLFEDKKSEAMSQSLKKFTAEGPAEILMYFDGVTADSNEPLKIQANKSIIYQPQSDQMFLEGDCVCQVVRLQDGTKQINTLKAERIAVQLVEKRVAGANQMAVEQVSALGPNVRLISQSHGSSPDQPISKPSVFVADKIDYIADSNAIIAPGATELTFYPQTESAGVGDNPVTIESKKQTVFLMDMNKIIFEGDCLCRMSSKDPNDRRYYTLSSPKIAVSLADDPGSASGIETVSASGGVVRLVSSPLADMADDNKNGKTTFITNRIDYSLENESIVSHGPSELTFYPEDSSESKLAFPIRMTAQESVSFLTAKNQVIFEGDCRCTMLVSLTGELKNYTLSSPKIIANLSSGQQVSTIENMIALGPLELVFYVEGIGAAGEPVPVTINAEKSASFLPEANKVVFEGDCICTMVRYNKDIQKKHILSSQKLIATLPKESSGTDSAGVEHLTAIGGLVQITVVEMSDDMTLGFSKIKCNRLDYDDAKKTILALGPGMVIVDNSRVKTVEENANSDGYSLSRPCYVFLRDFDKLQYYINSNKIVALGGDKRLLIDYFPAGKDDSDSQIRSTAGFLQVNLVNSSTGQTQISTVHAGRGITYEDSKNQIVANEMFYDSALSIITARGSEEHSCMLNGVFVDEIQYDLKAGSILKTTLGKPSKADIEK